MQLDALCGAALVCQAPLHRGRRRSSLPRRGFQVATQPLRVLGLRLQAGEAGEKQRGCALGGHEADCQIDKRLLLVHAHLDLHARCAG